MSAQPLITVLMCVHNDRNYIAAAARSILQQTFEDFEFLIIDDGSTDGTAELLDGLDDPRIRLYRNPANLGLTRSLNIGLDAARGSFIARMDGDDLSEPDRLDCQLRFMQDHPEVGLVGSSRTLIDEAGRTIAVATVVEDDLSIRHKSLLGNPFAHPSMMLRADLLRSRGLRYDESYQTAQDYDLWVRMLALTAGANLPRPLLRYRLRGGISKTRKAEQLAGHDRISMNAIAAFAPGFSIRADEVRQLRGRFGGYSVRDGSLDETDPVWRQRYLDLYQAFVEHHRHHPELPGFLAATPAGPWTGHKPIPGSPASSPSVLRV